MIRREGRILLTQRPLDSGHLPGYWEFPGGKPEPGESPEQALARELREELGVEISVGEEIMAVRHSYPEKTVDIRFFEATIISGVPEPREVQDLRWVTTEELRTMQLPEADRPLVEALTKRSG